MKKEKEIEVTTWEELMGELFYDDWAGGLNRFRSSYVYRGLEESSYQLTTSLNRQGKSHLEKHLLRNFKKYSQLNDRHMSEWNWLALAQHHGLPTRLLDWTYSPFVALHFATADYSKFGTESVIWAVNYVDASKYVPDQLSRVMNEEGSYIFTAEMLDKEVRGLEELSGLKKEVFPVFLEPPSLDSRIVNQYGVFSLMSDPDVAIDDWLKDSRIERFKIVIPPDLLWKIRDRLDQANLNERVLFPGLDGLAKWLRRHYKDIRISEQGVPPER